MEFRYGARLTSTLFGLAALALACAGPAGSPPAAQPPVAGQPGGTESPTGESHPRSAPVGATPSATAVPRPTAPTSTQSVAGSEAAVQAAKRDLAQRTGASNVSVVSATAVQWPDSALGCPKPGRFYSQVVTPGYRVVLSAAGKEYEYHSDLDGTVVLCESR